MSPRAAAVSSDPPISPPPRPLKKAPPAEDVIAAYNEGMREAVKPFYRALQQAGEAGVPLRAELLDQVNWLRARGVRINAKMRPEGTVYVLVPRPDVAPNLEGTSGLEAPAP